MNKEYISTLLPIDNIFGETESHTKEIIILVCGIAIDVFAYIFIMLPYGITYWVAIVLGICWVIYWLSEILGKGPQKRKFYKQQIAGKLAAQGDIIKVDLVEGPTVFYSDGMIAQIISGYLRYNINDNTLTLKLEKFLDAIEPLNYNIYFYNVDDIIQCTDNVGDLSCYTDKTVAKERFDYYVYQDEYSADNSMLFNVVIMVRSGIDEIANLKAKMDELAHSDSINVFAKWSIVEDEELVEVLGRDLDFDVDLNDILITKYGESATTKDIKVVSYGRSEDNGEG